MIRTHYTTLVQLLVSLLIGIPSLSYTIPNAINRRSLLSNVFSKSTVISICLNTLSPTAASCKEPQQPILPSDLLTDIEVIDDASTALTNLLNNWAKATIDCTYADVPRELLSQKNKEELLEKAKTSALFDKSASVVSCKRSNKIVRDYIGVTGKGPLVNIDKLILKRDLVDYYVNGDKLDDYYTEADLFSQAMSKATASSYAAGVADFDSYNNFVKDDTISSEELDKDGDSNLAQTKRAIIEADSSLKKIFAILKEGASFERPVTAKKRRR